MPIGGGSFEQVGVQAVVDGFQPYMQKLGKMESKTSGFGSKIGSALKAGALIGGAALVGLGVAALKLGGEFDKAYDKIRIGTGATGEDLEGLKVDFKKVFSAIPTDMESASEAITQFNTLTGATGETLQTLSKQALEAARMMGEDSAALIDQFGGAMNAWEIPARSAPAVLDAIFDVAQRTNVPMTKLVGTLSSYGPVLKNLGISVTDSIAIFGSFEKAGIEVSRVMPGINAFMRKLAAEGVEDLRGGFEDMIEQIKNAETDTEALNLATQAFGAEGAQRLSVAARAGVLDIQELRDGMRDSTGAILNTAKATESWTEKLKILRNKALVKLEPVLIGVFDGLTKLFTLIETKVIPALEKWWKKHGPGIIESLKEIGTYLRDFFAPALDTLADLWDNLKGPMKAVGEFLIENKPLLIGIAVAVLALVAPWLAVIAVIAVVLAKWDDISKLFTKTIPATIDSVIKKVEEIPVIGEIFKGALETVKTVVFTAFKIIKNRIETAIKAIREIINIVTALIRGDWDAAWTGIKNLAKVLLNGIKTEIKLVLLAIKHIAWAQLVALGGVFSDAWNGIKNLVSGIVTSLKGLLKEHWKEIVAVALSILFPPAGGLFALVTNAGGVRDDVVAAFKAIPGLLLGLVQSFKDAAFDLGDAILDGLMEGLKQTPALVESLLTGLKDLIASVINSAIDKINDAIPNSIGFKKHGIGVTINLPDDPIPQIELHRGAWNIPRDTVARLQAGEMVLARPQAEAVRDTVLAPQPTATPGLDRLAQALEGRGGDMSVSVSAPSQEQIAEEVAGALRGLAFELGRAGA